MEVLVAREAAALEGSRRRSREGLVAREPLAKGIMVLPDSIKLLGSWMTCSVVVVAAQVRLVVVLLHLLREGQEEAA